jgi:hypothetical protein
VVHDRALALLVDHRDHGAIVLEAEVDTEVVAAARVEGQRMCIELLVDAAFDLLLGEEVAGPRRPAVLEKPREDRTRKDPTLALTLGGVHPRGPDALLERVPAPEGVVFSRLADPPEFERRRVVEARICEDQELTLGVLRKRGEQRVEQVAFRRAPEFVKDEGRGPRTEPVG